MNEDLGQIAFVFSDKTGMLNKLVCWNSETFPGTLTRNIMTFKRVSIEGRVYASMHVSTKPGKHRLPDYNNNNFSANPDSRLRNPSSELLKIFFDDFSGGASRSRNHDRLLKGNTLIMHLKSKRPQASAIRDTLRIMSVCHTVIPERVGV